MSAKRDQLEAVATDAVQRSGLHALSFRTLADGVGVKSSSVHYYFPEKADLAGVLIEKYRREFGEKLGDISRQKHSARKKLDAFVDIFDEVAKEDKFCLCGMMAAEVALLSDANRALLKAYFEQAEDWLRALFEAHAKDVRSDMKPLTLARVVMSGLEGAILIDRVDRRHERLRAQRELVRSLVV